MKKESLSILGINSLKEISSIFLGPFLVSYFFKNSMGSIPTIAFFYICVYSFSTFIWFWVAKYSNNKHKLLIYRVGILLNCIYMLPFIFLKEQVINYIIIIALIQASTSAFFYSSGNFLVGDKIEDEHRKDYELIKEVSSSLIRIAIPIFLGFMITTTNYASTAIIVLILSVIQFLLSFNLKKPREYKNDTYHPFIWFKEKIKDRGMKLFFLGEYFKGLTINSGALSTIVTIFIISRFNSDETLGFITSFAYAISIVFAFLYNKYFKEEDNGIIILCSILPFIITVILVFFTSASSILVYNLIYSALISTLLICANVRLWNLAESKYVKKVDRVEFWFIREMFLNLGRVTSFLILLLIVKYCNEIALYGYTILLALVIVFIGFTTIHTKTNNLKK